MNQVLSKIIANKHTTIAGALYAAAKWGVPFLTIWIPTKKAQLDQTAGLLEGAAVFYGLVMAGDAKPANPPVDSPPPKP